MTVGHPKNALFISVERAAQEILRAADLQAGEVYVPAYWRPIMAIIRNIPEALFQKVGALSGR
jgi:short-subunit dehydrogenase